VAHDGVAVLSLVRDLVNLGVDHIKIRTLRSPLGDAPALQTKVVANAVARLELALWAERLLRRGQTIEVDVADRSVPSNYQCRLSTLFTVIDPFGDVRMCWNDVDPDKNRVIGNVFQDSLASMWGSARHHAIVGQMSPRNVCNSPQGCHCRVVGYQDVVDRVLPTIDSRGPQVSPPDRFI
jgi:radical SAM protein with 4Fe4S-binding SPASM domain